jgi:hypothetical protein
MMECNDCVGVQTTLRGSRIQQLQLLPIAGTRSGESLRGSLGCMDRDQEIFHEQNEKEAKVILRLKGIRMLPIIIGDPKILF